MKDVANDFHLHFTLLSSSRHSVIVYIDCFSLQKLINSDENFHMAFVNGNKNDPHAEHHLIVKLNVRMSS